jgi:hypothetical protein
MPNSPGRHRHESRRHQGRHRIRTRSSVPLPGLLLAGCLIGSAAVFTTSGTAAGPLDQQLSGNEPNALIAQRAEAEDHLSRALDREPTASPTAPPVPTPSPEPPPPPGPPVPVAGLNQAQMNNAAVIVQVGRSLGLPERALVIGVATAMQESNLFNVASYAVPDSLGYPHEGTGADHDSVGIFQQRPSQGWGTVENLMRPAYQAEKFFSELVEVDWVNMSLTAAAQAVQRSAYPSAYAKHETRAQQIVAAL